MNIPKQPIFDSIALRYELVNTLISFGLWKRWSQLFIQNLMKNFVENERILDLCSGTGIVPKMLLTHLRKQNKTLPFIDCVDLSSHMLEIARKNLVVFEPFVSFIQADATHISQPDSFYDAVTIAYGLRNVPLFLTIQEIKRVLKPGGKLFALELTQPSSLFLRKLHSLYFSTWARSIGFLFTGNKEAYSYLLRSIQAFSLSETLRTLQEEGFTDIITHQIMYGSVTFITAQKK